MAWSILYVFSALGGALLIYYIFSKTKKSKRQGGSPSRRCDAIRKTLPLGSKSGWELIGVEHGLRLWERVESEVNGSLFATSAILPVSLEIAMKVLTDPSIIVEWDPWIKHVSLVSMSKETESSKKFSADVISVNETLNTSSRILEAFDTLVGLFKSDPKLYSRTWQYEKDTHFWLHSAVVEPNSADPVFLTFMAFPLEGTNKKSCEVNIISDATSTSSFNPCSLTAKLSGLKHYVVRSQSKVVYPEIKNGENDVVDDEDIDFEEIPDGNSSQELEESSANVTEAFVDITGVYLKLEKEVQRYKVAIDNALKKILECYNAKDKDNGWELIGKVKDVDILKKPASPGFSIWDCAKGTNEINVPIHYLLAYCRDLRNTAEYDDMFHKGHVIEQLGGLTDIVYLEYKAIWPVSGRDFCAFNAVRVLAEDTYVMVARSVKHPSCPESKKYVRGKILIGGFVMKEISKEPPRIMLTYVTHVDLSGSVPSRIVNKVTAGQPQAPAAIKHFVEKMYRYELANPNETSDFKAKAMDILEKIKKAKTLTLNAEPTEPVAAMSDEEQPEVTAQAHVFMNGDVGRGDGTDNQQIQTPHSIRSSPSPPSVHSPTISISPFDNINADYKTIGNQACAGLLQEVFEVSQVDITRPMGSSGTVYEQWEYRGTEKGVMMFRKVHVNEKMHSCLGKGIIPCSPSKVWETIKTPTTRYRYDNMLKETRMIEEISESVGIEYLHFETANCFQKQARDFVALRILRKERDKYLLAVTSVEHPSCPEKSDVKRGKILASGWVIEPVLRNGQLYSVVTYLSQVNPEGNYPANLINLVARKQPLCIAYLRKYLDNPTNTPHNS